MECSTDIIRKDPAAPLLVLSGPGAGKTELFARRVVFFVTECEIPARNILGFTFTKNASLEMRERVKKLAPQSHAKSLDDVRLCTFHAFAHHLCMNSLTKTEPLTMFGAQQCKEILGECCSEVKSTVGGLSQMSTQGTHKDVHTKTLYNMIQVEKVKSGGEAALLNHPSIAEVYKLYKRCLHEHRAMDFTDLLVTAVDLMKTRPAVLDALRRQYTHIMVDEFQDINELQFEIIRLLVGDTKRVTVVGDDDQCIYRYAGANEASIQWFLQQWPSTNIAYLSHNYRCSGAIVQASSGLIKYNRKRQEKNLFTSNPTGSRVRIVECYNPRAEIAILAQYLHRLKSSASGWNSTAILCRTREVLKYFQAELSKRSIPIKVRVSRFKEPNHTVGKYVIAVMRLAANENNNIAAATAIGNESAGPGEVVLAKARALAARNRISLMRALRVLTANSGLLSPGNFGIGGNDGNSQDSGTIDRLPAALRQSARSFVALIDDIRKQGSMGVQPEDLLFSIWKSFNEGAKGNQQSARDRAWGGGNEKVAASAWTTPAKRKSSQVDPVTAGEEINDAMMAAIGPLIWRARMFTHQLNKEDDPLAAAAAAAITKQPASPTIASPIVGFGDLKKSAVVVNMITNRPTVQIQKRNLLEQFVESLEQNSLECVGVEGSKEGIELATVHQSKGLEWDHVFVVRVNDGVMPMQCHIPLAIQDGEHDDEVCAVQQNHEEDERRLLYVAMTRAKQSLTLMHLLFDGTNQLQGASPFILEVQKACCNEAIPCVEIVDGSEAANAPPPPPPQHQQQQQQQQPDAAAAENTTKKARGQRKPKAPSTKKGQ